MLGKWITQQPPYLKCLSIYIKNIMNLCLKIMPILFCQILNPFDNLHLIGIASRTIDLAVSIKVIIELFGLVSKNCVPV